MNKPVFYIILLLYSCPLKAQENLVPNGSFEEYYSCPTAPDNGDGQLERCKYWYKPNYATSDYINACAPTNSGVNVPSNFVGYQKAYEGVGYVGLVIYSNHFSTQAEYIQCKLNKALKPCFTYYFSMRVSLSDYSSYSTSSIGMRIDKSPIKKEFGAPNQYDGFELTCNVCSDSFVTDTANWVKISGQFIADGGEEFLTIGRFFDTSLYSNENYPVAPFQCDSCFLLDNICYYYIDSIRLIEVGYSKNIQEIPNVLTANGDAVNDVWLPVSNCGNKWDCIIYNRWGNVVYKFNQDGSGWNGKGSDDKPLAEGVYYYLLQEEKNTKTGFIQLIR